MSYTFRYLTAEERAAAGQQATAKPVTRRPDDVLQRTWEISLAGHYALRDAATDPEVKRTHADAVTTLEAALTKAAAR